MKKIKQIKKEIIERSGKTFMSAVRASMNPEKAAANAALL
jgi:hypothetical protein